MSDFEFLMSLFGLILGFTLVEVLSGLVSTTKTLRTPLRKSAVNVRLGWLTPILALFVILDITSYWVNIWGIRETLPVGFDTMFGGLIIAGTYYFAASMIFPDDVQKWPDLDEWFWLHRRQVIGPIFVVNLVWVTLSFILVDLSTAGRGFEWGFFIAQAILFGCLSVAFLVRRPWVVATALGVLCFLYLLQAIIVFAYRLA